MKKAHVLQVFSCVSFAGLLVVACTLTPAPLGAGGTMTSAGTSAAEAGRGGTSGSAGTVVSPGGTAPSGATSAGGESGADGAGCSATEKLCGGVCVAIDNPAYGCGATSCDASTCPSQATGATLICEGSSCVIGTCPTNYKKCGDKCVTTDANHGCADAARCTACANNEACAGNPSTCQCVPTPMATVCSDKCGSLPNGCGANYDCGCTSSSAPVCVANTCKQCAQVSDCPSGTFNCSNNTCVCRLPNSANLIKDGGFDGYSAIINWTRSLTSWSADDVDGCPASGSMALDGSISRCVEVSQVPAGGAEYSLGLKYKSDDGASCVGSFYQDVNCSQSDGTAGFPNLGTDISSTWSQTFVTAQAPEGTRSIQVQCTAGASTLYIDQIYLRVSGPSGSGF